MRLENNYRALISQGFDSIQKSLELARMMRIIVIHIRTVEFALKLESSARSGKTGKAVFYCRRLYSEADAGRGSRQSVLKVMHAGNMDVHCVKQFSLVHNIKLSQ